MIGGQHAVAARQIDQQDGKGALVDLDSTPVWHTVEPGILWPASVRVLDRPQILKHAVRLVAGAAGDQRAGRLHQVPAPDQVIAAQIVVALVKAPRN